VDGARRVAFGAPPAGFVVGFVPGFGGAVVAGVDALAGASPS
jgi:hypothetical protein